MAKKTKLTRAIASKMAGSILSATLPGLLARLGAELYVLMKEARDEIFTPEAVAALKAVPLNFGLYESPVFRVKLTNNTVMVLPVGAELKSTGNYNGWTNTRLTDTALRQCATAWEKSHRPVNEPFSVPTFNQHRVYILENEDLIERLKVWNEARANLSDTGVQDMLDKVARTLQTYDYVEDLETGWPEVWDMAQQYLAGSQPVVALPTTSTRTLNTVLGLPVAA